MRVLKLASVGLAALGGFIALAPTGASAQTPADCIQVNVERLNSQMVVLTGNNVCSDEITLAGYLGAYSNQTTCHRGTTCQYRFKAPSNTKYETKYCVSFKFGAYRENLDSRKFCAPFKI